MPRAFTRSTSTSLDHKTAVGEDDDNAELVFSVPPSVNAVLTRCAAQTLERAASGSAAAAGGGLGTGNAHLAATTGSAGFLPSPVTPSLTPYAAEHSTVSLSSEDGTKCRFFITAIANGGEGNGDPVGGDGGGGDGGSVASGKGDSSTEDRRNRDAGVVTCGTHAAGDGKGGRGEDVDGRQGCQAPEASSGDEPLLLRRPSGRHEPTGGSSGDTEKTLNKVLAAEEDDANGPVDSDGGGNDQRKLSRFSREPAPVTPTRGVSMRDLSRFSPEQVPVTRPTFTTGVSMQDLEAALGGAAFASAERVSTTNDQ